MTGSFLFVKPSNPDGKPGTEYSDTSPRYPYDRASWEWLLERALRRTLIPWALTKSHSQVILYGHEDQYSMHRWGSYGKSYDADSTPSDYTGIGGPGSSSRKTDADLSINYRVTPLPGEWKPNEEVPGYEDTMVAYGIADLDEMVARLPFSLEWLHPDWTSGSLEAWDLTTTTTEKTKGTAKTSPDALVWSWKTTVEHIPYTIPIEVPFKCLSHMRTDDDTVKVIITNDDNKSIEVETAPTPASAPKTIGGSIRNYHNTQVRGAIYGAAYEAGWALSAFSIPYIHELDYSASTGSAPYDRDGKTNESYSTIGCLFDVPDSDSGNITISIVSNDSDELRFIHEVDWDGKPTWWHANDFPKGLDSVLSPKLKEQLKALCPKCQPAIPPFIPAFHEKFPDDRRLPWEHWPFQPPTYMMDWMRHLTLACTPFDMSARLDAMTTTVHRVPALFAKIKTVTTEYETSESEQTSSNGVNSWTKTSENDEVTIEGATTTPIPTPSPISEFVDSASSFTSEETIINKSSTTPEGSYSSRYKNRRTTERSFESNSDFLVCLRSTSNTTLSARTTTKTTREEDGTAFDEPIISETESIDGELPKSYDPDPDDLLFPDWVLPWIETAELFASIESRIQYGGGYDINTTDNSYSPADGESTSSHSGSGSGTRTHEAKRKFVSLGEINKSTGRFPALDTAAIFSEVDPDPTSNISTSFTATTTSTTDEKSNTTTKTVTTSKQGPVITRLRSVSYYVVIKWNFDRTDPETLETDSPTADLYRDLADAKIALADAERELVAAEAALATAKADLRSAEAGLEHAQKQLDNPESAAPDILEEAEAKLAEAKQKLEEAQGNKSGAEPDFILAQNALKVAEDKLQGAKAKYDAAVAGGNEEMIRVALKEPENAESKYSEAVEEYNEAANKFEDAKSDEESAQQAVDDAQAYYDRVLEDLMDILNDAVDGAQKTVNEALARVKKWEEKIEELEEEIKRLKAEVEKAEQAIRDAESSGT